MIDDDDVVAECGWFDDYAEDCSTLLDQRDDAGLIQRCRQRFERYPDDTYAVDDLADAYVQAGQFEQAIAFVGPYYEADPDSFDLQACILDALAGMRKAWDEFPWKSPPPLVRMSEGVNDQDVGRENPVKPQGTTWSMSGCLESTRRARADVFRFGALDGRRQQPDAVNSVLARRPWGVVRICREPGMWRHRA